MTWLESNLPPTPDGVRKLVSVLLLSVMISVQAPPKARPSSRAHPWEVWSSITPLTRDSPPRFAPENALDTTASLHALPRETWSPVAEHQRSGSFYGSAPTAGLCIDCRRKEDAEG
jgi:hypothetical protein